MTFTLFFSCRGRRIVNINQVTVTRVSFTMVLCVGTWLHFVTLQYIFSTQHRKAAVRAGISWRDSNIKAIDKKNESSVSWPGLDPLQTQTGGNIFQSTEIRHAAASSRPSSLSELTVWILLGLSQFDWWMPSQYSSETKHQMASAFYLLLGCKYCDAVFPQMFIRCEMKTEDIFTTFLAENPYICHQIISPPRHLSSLLNKLIRIVTLLVAHITSLAPPTKVYLLLSSDVCFHATRQPGVSIKYHIYFFWKEHYVPITIQPNVELVLSCLFMSLSIRHQNTPLYWSAGSSSGINY